MAEITSINPADLRTIERNLGAIHNDLEVIDKNVGTVDNNVRVVYDEIGQLARDFKDFIAVQVRANRLGQAETRLVKIRQEIEKKYGHYDTVRRTTTGILQANDLGLVKRETISCAAEELMLQTPNYWLAPCLVALAAWINDKRDLAEKAVKEAIRRDDEKTSLFFGLVCRRADRKQSCLKWIQRYLANQDEENLDRKTVIILDAFASGLFGSDTEGVVSRQMAEWLDHLAEKPGFVEKQTEQWSEAINLKRKPIDTNTYTYLKKYSKTWPVLENIMEGAMLHAEIFNYFSGIFEQSVSNDTVKQQLDEILNDLVSNFDDEELPYRREEQFEQFVVDFGGDEARAKQSMSIEKSAFETHKDFTQLLTDSAMKPESSHASVSTQKFAIALSKEWVTNAYNDIIAKNRMQIPHEIEINVDTFNDKTVDGQNEEELIGKFNSLVDTEKATALSQFVMTAFDNYCLPGGAVIGIVGLILLFINAFFGVIAIICGVGAVLHYYSKQKTINKQREAVSKQFEEKRTNGTQIIRAVLAEVVDFRMEFKERDSESQKVLDFLEQLAPEQYVRKLAEGNRRIRV